MFIKCFNHCLVQFFLRLFRQKQLGKDQPHLVLRLKQSLFKALSKTSAIPESIPFDKADGFYLAMLLVSFQSYLCINEPTKKAVRLTLETASCKLTLAGKTFVIALLIN